MFLFFFSLDWSSALVIDGGELDAGCTERGGGGWWSRTPKHLEEAKIGSH